MPTASSLARPTTAQPAAPAPRLPVRRIGSDRAAAVAGIVIGVSTGGPPALTELLPKLPADLGVPVLLVQHMPPVFTKMLAERLDAASALRVVEATDGMPVTPGTVYVAPGGSHLALRRSVGLYTELTAEPPENGCRPAVDVTLRAATRFWGAGTLAVILTGMGTDGTLGGRAVVEAGGRVLAQDEATSAVWGMPGSATRAGLTDAVLPLSEIAGRIHQMVQARVATPTPAGTALRSTGSR